MSGKAIKKQKQFLRREYSKTLKDIAEMNSQFLKPKPKWIPMFIWIACLKIFVRIN